MPKRTYEIDGTRFDDLEGFYDEVSRVLIPKAKWGRNLDAFNDILRGGFGTPAGGFVLRWTHAGRSRRVMPRFETVLEIIRAHGAGGSEEADGVELVLA